VLYDAHEEGKCIEVGQRPSFHGGCAVSTSHEGLPYIESVPYGDQMLADLAHSNETWHTLTSESRPPAVSSPVRNASAPAAHGASLALPVAGGSPP
jgi:hypothetical protein